MRPNDIARIDIPPFEAVRERLEEIARHVPVVRAGERARKQLEGAQITSEPNSLTHPDDESLISQYDVTLNRIGDDKRSHALFAEAVERLVAREPGVLYHAFQDYHNAKYASIAGEVPDPHSFLLLHTLVERMVANPEWHRAVREERNRLISASGSTCREAYSGEHPFALDAIQVPGGVVAFNLSDADPRVFEYNLAASLLEDRVKAAFLGFVMGENSLIARRPEHSTIFRVVMGPRSDHDLIERFETLIPDAIKDLSDRRGVLDEIGYADLVYGARFPDGTPMSEFATEDRFGSNARGANIVMTYLLTDDLDDPFRAGVRYDSEELPWGGGIIDMSRFGSLMVGYDTRSVVDEVFRNFDRVRGAVEEEYGSDLAVCMKPEVFPQRDLMDED